MDCFGSSYIAGTTVPTTVELPSKGFFLPRSSSRSPRLLKFTHIGRCLRRHQLRHLLAVCRAHMTVGVEDQLAPIAVPLPFGNHFDIDASLNRHCDEETPKGPARIARKTEPGTRSLNRLFCVPHGENSRALRWGLALVQIDGYLPSLLQ